MDFHKLPTDWDNRWDFIYSNSIDHAISATEVYNEWYRTLKTGGVMAIGFDMHGNKEGSKMSNTDCCLFNQQNVDSYFKSEPFTVKEKLLVEHIPGNLFYFIIVKK